MHTDKQKGIAVKFTEQRAKAGSTSQTTLLALRDDFHRVQRRAATLGLVFAMSSCMAMLCSAVPARAAACVNEELRASLGETLLPDCRAYEQVTPSYKEGAEEEVIATSRNGERVYVDGLGESPGDEGEEAALFGDVRLLQRGELGWQASSLNPPNSEYPGQDFFSVNPNTGESLWALHSASQSQAELDLYVRSAGVSPGWHEIGPLFTPAEAGGPPSTFADPAETTELNIPIAATSNYDHVVLQALSSHIESEASNRWPFDSTLGNYTALYEYAGSENVAPTLVNVLGAKGSDELVGRCGSRLGSSEIGLGSMYNAISADGETIFFTPLPEDMGQGRCEAPASEEPAVAEVYARIHGSRSSAAPAETVDVSAVSPNCAGACATGRPADKLFEGASEEGTRVFFASTQALITGASEDTTPRDGAVQIGEAVNEKSGCAQTTGAGGCNLYEYDLAERRLVLVAGGAEVLGVARIAADGSRVYFVARGVLAGSVPQVGKAQLAPTAGSPNLYVYDAVSGQTTFIATLGEGDEADWKAEDDRPVQASAGEGRFLVFPSTGVALTPDDHSSHRQLFEYDSVRNELVRVSKGEVAPGEEGELAEGELSELGYNENGNAVAGVTEASLAELEQFAREDFHQNGEAERDVTADGGVVVFDSRGRMSVRAPSAEAGCSSVYEYAAPQGTGAIGGGAVHLISDGLDAQPSKFAKCAGASLEGISAGARDIFFSTDDPLLPSDGGLQRNVYDARSEGGFPAAATASVECGLEACHGATQPSPGPAGALSAAQAPEAPVSVSGPALRIISRAVRGGRVVVSVQVARAGTIALRAPGLKASVERASRAGRYTLRARLLRPSSRAKPLRRSERLALTLTLASPHAAIATAHATLTVRG